MLKGQKKHIDKKQVKTKHEAPRSVNYRATQNKNNIGTTALERSVVYTTGGLKVSPSTNFTLGPDIILNKKKIHIKFGSHNGFLTQSMHLSENTKSYQIKPMNNVNTISLYNIDIQVEIKHFCQ